MGIIINELHQKVADFMRAEVKQLPKPVYDSLNTLYQNLNFYRDNDYEDSNRVLKGILPQVVSCNAMLMKDNQLKKQSNNFDREIYIPFDAKVYSIIQSEYNVTQNTQSPML